MGTLGRGHLKIRIRGLWYEDGGRRQGCPGIVATTIIFGGRKMKRILLFSLIAVLISPGPVSAVLTVNEYIPGEKVTLDSNTGNYWYWNLPDFVNMTYGEQNTAIAGLGNYGNIAGGWHMATLDEMTALWVYDAFTIASSFAPTLHLPTGQVRTVWQGRYDRVYPGTPVGHAIAELREVVMSDLQIYYSKFNLVTLGAPDSTRHTMLGSWVVSSQPVVPVPGSLLLAATGLLSMLGLKRWRRKH